MKQNLTTHRRALGLLLAAAALPSTALYAQDTTTAPPPTVIDTTPAPVTPPTSVIEAPAPVITTSPPVSPPSAAVDTVVPEPAPTATTSTTRTTRTTRTAAPARGTAAPARGRAPIRTAAPVETAAPPVAAPLAASPPIETLPPLAAPEPLPVETAQQPLPAENDGGSIWPWLIAGAVLLGLAAFLASRRRRRVVEEEVYEQPATVAVAEPVRAEPFAAAPLAAPLATMPLAATIDAPLAAAETGRPWLDLAVNPVRAGVGDDDAVVEFELTVDNQGTAPARDVRISTWMVASGSSTEAEQSLIDQSASDLPELDIAAGSAKRIEAAVGLPKSGLHDSILPIVCAEARYRLPDGSEGRTSASFAVGVPDGEELAHFDVEHPSGLHDDVEARRQGELERV